MGIYCCVSCQLVAFITVKRYLAACKNLKSMCAKIALREMRFIKLNVFDRTLVMTEASKNTNLIIKELKLELPDIVNL